MAQTGYTPISIYYSSTAGNTPTAGNLVAGELAINTADGKLFYKDSAGVVQVIAGKGGAGVAGGSNTQVQYNSSGSLAGSANFTFNGTTVTIANDASISGLTVGKGGGSVSTNTAIGASALSSNSAGTRNTVFGSTAGSGITGSRNVAVGDNILATSTSGNDNVAIGDYTMRTYTGSSSTAVGAQAMANGTPNTGDNNTAIGAGAMNANASGASNTAVGASALTSNTTASNNTAVGYQAGYSNTTGDRCVYVGTQAGYSGTTAISTAIGYKALYAATTGTENTAVGFLALTANTTGGFNTSLADQSLYNNTTGSNNTAVGFQALLSNTTASNNTAVGYQAGYTKTTGNSNSFIGAYAGYSATTGAKNCFVGQSAGYAVTSGGSNTIIGGYDGNSSGLDIRTASNYIVLSDGDGNPRAYWDSNGVLTQNATANDWVIQNNNKQASGNIYGLLCNFTAQAPNNTTSQFYGGLDNVGYKFRVYSNGGIANYSANNVNLSDETLKKDIQLAPNYLDKLCQIPVKTFLFKDQTDTDLNLGVIAQEVQAVCPELVGTMDIGKEGEADVKLAIYEADLKYAMLKAIQELKAEVDSLKQQLGK
jgi:hypothetical protein